MAVRNLEVLLNSILEDKTIPPKVSICHRDNIEDFFRLERQIVCKFFLKDDCKRGDKCMYRHQKEFPNAKFKVQLCRNFMDKGVCSYGEHCSFAHGDKDLRKPFEKSYKKSRNDSSRSPS